MVVGLRKPSSDAMYEVVNDGNDVDDVFVGQAVDAYDVRSAVGLDFGR